MKPLYSPTVELQTSSALTLGFAAVVGVIVAGASMGSLIEFVLMAVFYGGAVYAITLVRVEKSVQAAKDSAGQSLESASATRRRVVAQRCVALAALVALAILFGNAPLIGGIAAGAGASSMAIGLWVSRWEQEHLARIFRDRTPYWAIRQSGFGLGQWYRVPNADE